MKATKIKELTTTSIALLLHNDIELTVDRVKFEDYITEGTGEYQYTMDHYEPVTGHRETNHVITLDEYWKDYGEAQVSHINDYIESEPGLQKDIAMLDIEDYVRHEMNSDLDTDIILLKSKISHYAHLYFQSVTA
jgi:hypothetical protein